MNNQIKQTIRFTKWDDKVLKNWSNFNFGQNLKRRARGQRDIPQNVPFRATKSGLELWLVEGDKNPTYTCTWEHFDECVKLSKL